MMMNPAFAAQWQQNPSAITDLLDDFSTLLDTEWKLLLCLAVILVTLMYGSASAIVVRHHPRPHGHALPQARPSTHRCLLFLRRDPAPTQIWTSNHRVHWGWRVSFGLSVFGFVVALIFLIEPRPSHWLPSLSRFEHSVWTSRWSEHKQRMRRWWRWRKKYATNTRLNV